MCISYMYIINVYVYNSAALFDPTDPTVALSHPHDSRALGSTIHCTSRTQEHGPREKLRDEKL